MHERKIFPAWSISPEETLTTLETSHDGLDEQEVKFRQKHFGLNILEKGKKFTRGASGLLAQIFQHETDHLNGILFIDHAKDVKEEDPSYIGKMFAPENFGIAHIDWGNQIVKFELRDLDNKVQNSIEIKLRR